MVRFKNRYLVVKVENNSNYYPLNDAFTTGAIAQHIRNSITTNFGIHGSSLASNSLSVKYCNPNTGTILLRISREQLCVIWTCLTLLSTGPTPVSYSSVKEAPVVDREFSWRWTVLHVSGTIKSAQKNTIRILRKLQSSDNSERLKEKTDEREILSIEH